MQHATGSGAPSNQSDQHDHKCTRNSGATPKLSTMTNPVQSDTILDNKVVAVQAALCYTHNNQIHRGASQHTNSNAGCGKPLIFMSLSCKTQVITSNQESKSEGD